MQRTKMAKFCAERQKSLKFDSVALYACDFVISLASFYISMRLGSVRLVLGKEEQTSRASAESQFPNPQCLGTRETIFALKQK